MSEEHFGVIEYAIFLGPVIFVIVVGAILFVFFSRQIVDIQFYNGEVILIRESGNVAYKGENYFKVIETPNRYILCISQKKYSTYKYMPPKIYEHEKYLRERIEKLKQ